MAQGERVGFEKDRCFGGSPEASFWYLEVHVERWTDKSSSLNVSGDGWRQENSQKNVHTRLLRFLIAGVR